MRRRRLAAARSTARCDLDYKAGEVPRLLGSRSCFAESPLRVLACFAGLAVLMTWPLAAHWATHLPLGRNDLWQNLWNFWWWKTALLELHRSPYGTDYLYFPFGASLALHTHSEINLLATLPITALIGPVAAYNTATLAAISLAGFGAYLLAREVVGSASAAIVAGVIFAFCPHQLEEGLEHLNLATTQFLPLTALFFLRTLHTGGGRNGVLLGVCFALNVLASHHYGVMALELLLLLALVELFPARRLGVPRRRQSLAAYGIAAATALVLLAPFLTPIVLEVAGGAATHKPFRTDRGIDLAFLLLPTDQHPLFGGLTRGVYAAYRSAPNVPFYVYLGFVPVLLALAGLPEVRRRRALLAWLIAGAVFFVIACGARPLIAGRWFDLTLPHAWFESIPLLRTQRHAHRFMVIVMLALALLAAAGAARLTRGGRRTWLCAAAVLLTLGEYAWLPFPLQAVAFPPYLMTLARQPDGGAVLDIPFGVDASVAINQGYQTVHGRPIAGGYVSVTPARALAALTADPVLGPLLGTAPVVGATIDVAHLRQLGFRTVILHLDQTDAALAARRAALPMDAPFHVRRLAAPEGGVPKPIMDALAARFDAAVGAAAYEDGRIRVYRLP